ncbi:related to AIM27 - member of a transmembrane complex required for efficient folding of proteins in the ER [Melanopsichium pennsylvanicum]|uniref:ER membrane protein complex subunit 3 n=2 Tax=Melanopsichium pennsylvanicum TaxID=63383 RepID=A0AAJ5C8A0_9BASI|nr:transmembrane protein [Melanopsichium pennsylvanicum 4]SNX87284.1 related to AIM27 - member of a transmembrane complex required for efficient folding of proteins in the ER [Melanopsichium pennsylvanicum]
MAAEQSLFLDSAIRDWVLIPILVVMILVGVLRHNVISLLNSAPKSIPAPALREQRIMARAGALRQNYFHLPPTSFLTRKAFLTESLSNGTYLQPKKEDKSEGPKNPFESAGGMDGMMDGMKKQMVMMIPQTVIMGWINFFFSGFVLLKLPFPLTVRFKVMLQRGIETPDLDVTWVSSLSWYFLTLFGLNAVYRLVLGDDNAADGTRDMAAMSGAAGLQMGANPAAPGQAPDFEKFHLAERDNLELVGLEDSKVRWIGDGIEDRVLALYS